MLLPLLMKKYEYVAVAGRSFSANIIKIVHLFIRKFCPMFLFKKMPTVWMIWWTNDLKKYIKLDWGNVGIRLNWNKECGV